MIRRMRLILVILPAASLASAGEFDPKLPAPLSPMEKLEQIPVEPGPFQPNWESLQAYRVPEWFPDAKFGIWAHWGPQAAGENGDWYARRIYQDGPGQQHHIRKFGHPCDAGYMEVINAFKAEKWDPDALMALYKKAGARYFVAMGSHHDGVDCWDSKHQPWNTANVGPKKDLVAGWRRAADREGLRFGVSFHSDFAWWWFQPAFLGSEKAGDKAGVPYDAARLTKADGKGKWWDGLDPMDLYGKALPEELTKGKWIDPKDREGGLKYGHVPNELHDKEYARWYCTKWTRRVQDVVHSYHPDLLYFDGTPYPFSGLRGGRGIATDSMQRIAADFYNTNAKEHGGKLQAVLNLKQRDLGTAILLDYESGFPSDIPPHPWQTDNTIGDWFFRPDCFYDAGMVIHELLEIVSRNGNLLLNVMLRPDGTLDPGGRQTLDDMARWMSVNAEGVFGTRAWTVWGEGSVVMNNGVMAKANALTPYSSGDFRFTRSQDGKALYAFGMRFPGKDPYLDSATRRVLLRALSTDSPLVRGEPTSVTVLGHNGELTWKRTAEGLQVALPPDLPGEHAFCVKVVGLTTVDDLAPNALRDFRARHLQGPGFTADNKGTFHLPAYTANLRGNLMELQGEGEERHVGNWSARGSASWTIHVAKAGAYRVSLDVAGTKANGEFVVEVGSNQLEGRTVNTGGLEKYKPIDVGTVRFVKTGPVKLTIRAKSAATWKPFDLRGMRIVPE
jgi:alpha-L-fucosidase